MYRIFCILGSLFLTLSLFASPYYHKVPAKSGDVIESFLSRYDLNDHQCNFDKFYALNKLNEDSRLRKGDEYYLPVLIYEYNGKSIKSTLKIKDWKTAVRIKDYNEWILKQNLRKKTVIESSILWVPHHELDCNTPAIIAKKPKPKKSAVSKEPKVKTKVVSNEDRQRESFEKVKVNLPRQKNREFAIFGKQHAYVPLVSEKLRGKVYYIVAGHGGPDPGAVSKVGNRTLCEDEYAYDVALRLVRNLIAHGATAYMITRDLDDGIRSGKYLKCDNDEYCWGDVKIPHGQKSKLFQRSDAVNDLYYKHLAQGIKEQYSLIVHIDSRVESERTDVFFYHFPKSNASKKMAYQLYNTLEKKYNKHRGYYHGKVSARDLHMLREVKTHSVYIELGNIQNPVDQTRFTLESNRQLLADWLYEGLVK